MLPQPVRLLPRGPVAVASRGWQGSRERMTTLVVRVTYDLRPVRSEVSSNVEPVRTADLWVEGARGATWLREPCDVVPAKESADVVVVGRAHAPAEGAATEVAVRVVVGDIDKTLRVTGPRRWSRDGAPMPPSPFRDAPMDWTCASGGEDSWNPVGVGDREQADLRGETPAPSVLSYGVELVSRDAYVTPAGLGPLAPRWPTRRDAAVPAALEWIDAAPAARLSWNEASRPAFFQCAPPDQRLSRAIRSDERIVLEGLDARHPRLVTNLPGLELHAVAVDLAGGRTPVNLLADTLWIDGDRGVATVTHRATVPTRAIEGRDVFVWLDGFDALVAQDMADSGGQTVDAAGAVARAATPFRLGSATVADEEEDAFERMAMGTMAVPEGLPLAASVPFTAAPRSSARTKQLAASTAAPASAPPPAVAAPIPFSPAMAAAPAVAVPRSPAWAPPPPPAAPAIVERIDTWKLHEQAAARRVGDEPPGEASARVEPSTTAAAAPAAAAPKPRAVEVVWFDSTTEVELAGRSRTLRDQLGEGDGDEWMSPAEVGGGGLERARRDVARWFRAAPAMEVERLHETMTRALEREDAERPFVVVAGELAWSFDPRESLRAWIALGTPLAADPRVKDAIENAERAMAENLVTIPDVLGAALERLREAVRSIAKLVGSTPIDAAAERYLVEERGFARRRVWGQVRLRAHLHARGARSALPVYLPDGAGWEAPLTQRFPARLVGELRTRQDPTEGAMVCLRAVALGVEIV
jgi:hypothetical protein